MLNPQFMLELVFTRCYSSFRCALLLFLVFGAQTVWAQNLIKGKVSDESGEPLIGATITVKGTTTGTITDVDGNFSLTLSGDQKTLVFSFIGFETTEVQLDDQSFISVVLQAKNEGLDEVVVVGYGVQKRINMTGAVSQINAEEL